MKHNTIDIMLTKILLTVGTFTGATTKILQDLDLLADLVLKFVSIVSFIVASIF
jgi:hypothetical protein